MEKIEFLDYLSVEFKEYCQIPSDEPQVKKEKKQFINGLMKAARIFGVSFDELNAVIESEKRNAGHTHPLFNPKDFIDIPTYIRNRVNITN